MPDTFLHGISITEPTDGVRPILPSSLAVIGLIATATAAVGQATTDLNAAFPIGARTLVTDVRSAVDRAGTGGTLAKALSAIADQGSPIVVVVRVDESADAAATETNVIAGIQLFLAAEGQLGVRPRILGAPGLDTLDVVEALVIVAKRLRGFVYAACRPAAADGAIAATLADAITYVEAFGDRELMPIWPETTGWNGHAVAIALGLRAALDERVGWHKTISNVAIAGVTGVSKDVSFDIRDPSTDAGLLNAAHITTIVRMNGYRFWGNHTTSDEPLFTFESATRTAQAIQDDLAAIEAPYIDQPMTVGLVRNLEEEGNAYLRRKVTAGELIGGRCWFDKSANPGNALAAGRLTLDLDYTAVAPAEGIINRLRITSAYYDTLGDQLSDTITG